MAPEQLEGNETTAATDIYALGLVAYEMLTGRPPFPVNAPLAGAFLRVKGPPPSPRAFAPKLDRASEAAILRCLEIDPRHRFPSAREAAAAFRENQQSIPAAIVSRIKAPFTRLCRVLAPQSLFASIALGSLVLLAMVAIYAGFRPEPGPTVLERVQITNDGFPKAYGVAAIDGSTLYFNEIREGYLILAEVSTSGGAVVPVPTPLGNLIAQDFNSSRSELLVIDGTGKNTANFDDGPLWALKTPAETLRRIGNVVANNAAWSPEGRTIAYAQAGRIFLCDPEGSDVRELVHPAGNIASLAWSPDGALLRFSAAPDTSSAEIWEIRRDGKGLHRVITQRQPFGGIREGRWASDGRYFLFDALHNGRLGLWAAREKATWRGGGPGQPVLLGGSLAIAGRPLPQPSTSDIFVLGTQAARTEVVRYNEQQSQFRPFISGLSADQLDISPDGQWLAYVTYPEETLWKCRRDGTGSSQLAPTSFAASAPRWSPDGTQTVFMGKDASMGAWRLYLIPEVGGVPQPLVETGAEQGVATWFPDSRALVFGNLIVSAPSWSSHSKIHQFDLVNRKLMTIPGSEGLWTARLSPDGRFIAALTSDNQTVMLYEVAKGTWSPLAHTQPISDIAWTRHSGAIFFDDLRHRDGIFRLTLNTHQIAKVASLAGIQAYSSWWLGLSADDSPMLVHDVGSEEIYALHCNFP